MAETINLIEVDTGAGAVFSPLPCEGCKGTGQTDKGWTCFNCFVSTGDLGRGQSCGKRRRITAKYIIIHRAEGLTTECKPKLAHADYEQAGRDIWNEANKILRAAARTAPEKGGYDKTDFTIFWSNGEIYQYPIRSAVADVDPDDMLLKAKVCDLHGLDEDGIYKDMEYVGTWTLTDLPEVK